MDFYNEQNIRDEDLMDLDSISLQNLNNEDLAEILMKASLSSAAYLEEWMFEF